MGHKLKLSVKNSQALDVRTLLTLSLFNILILFLVSDETNISKTTMHETNGFFFYLHGNNGLVKFLARACYYKQNLDQGI